MSVKCPIAKCGKKYTTQAFMESHADEAHPDWRNPKRKGWATPHGFVDLSEPMTYEQACVVAERAAKAYAEMFQKKAEVQS